MQPWNFGTEPERISFGDNVHVASNVNFVNHDITSFMFSYMDKEHQYNPRVGEIKIGNNVFIGAGSLVNKSIPSGTVAAGVPCRVVGKFEDYQKKLQII